MGQQAPRYARPRDAAQRGGPWRLSYLGSNKSPGHCWPPLSKKLRGAALWQAPLEQATPLTYTYIHAMSCYDMRAM